MLKVVFLTADGFEDEELIYPVIRMKELGFKITIATPEGVLVQGRLGYPVKRLVDFFGELADLKNLRSKDFDCVIIPGGFEAPDRVRRIPEVLSFLKAADHDEKVIAAICHGPQVLISSGILRGRRATGHRGILDDLVNAGVAYEDSPVVQDRNVITSRHPRDTALFMDAISKKFNQG